MQILSFNNMHYTRSNAAETISLPMLGILISLLLIFCGFLFSTYTVGLASSSWETARQLGLPFVIAELVVILFAVKRGFRSDVVWRKFPPYIRYLLTMFLSTYWISSVFVSTVKLPSIAHNLILLVHLIFAAAIAHCVAVTADGVRQMGNWIAGGLAVFCLMIAFAFVFHPPLSSMPNNEIVWQFAVPGFISVRLFGAFCGAVFCFLLGVLLIDEERNECSSWYYLWIALSAGLMIWSGTRAAVVGSCVALGFVVLMYKLWPRKQVVTAIIISIAAGAVIAVLLIPYGDPNFMLIAPDQRESVDAATGGRLGYWTAIWTAYRSVPLLGAGPFATFWILPPEQITHVQPHNILLQFLISWGLVATVPALSLLGIATWRVHRIVYGNRTLLPFLIMLDCLLVMSLFDGMTHFAQHVMLLAICYGVILGSMKEKLPGMPAVAV